MGVARTLTGTMVDDRTIVLDEAVDVGGPKVRLVLEPMPAVPPRTLEDVLGAIWAAQDAQGYTPRTGDEVNADLAAERASWGD